MPRQPQPWFRFYVETITDRKVRRLPPAHRWVWAAVLAAARDSPVPGALFVVDDEPMTVAELADFADVPEREVRKALATMEKLGMVELEGGLISVPKFHLRQFESDNVTARTRAFRERQKERSNDVPGNVSGTVVGTGSSRARPTEAENRPNSSTSKGSPTVPAGSIPRVVKLYVESCRDAGVAAPEESQAKVERSARSLLSQGFDQATVEDAARNAAVNGWTDLATQLQRDTARASPTNGKSKSTTDERFRAALDLADQLDQPERRAIG